MQKVAIRLHDLIGEADLIVSSPYVRAQHTAEILSQVFFETPVQTAAELVPHSPPAAFVRWLQAHARDHRKILAVGHEPQLSLFGSYILAGVNESVLDLKKSGVACFEVGPAEEIGPACAELKWLVPPKIWAAD